MKYLDAADHIVFEDVTERGRLIAQMDRVSWLATDALYAIKPNRDLLGLYITYQDGDQWRVAFGQLAPDETAFHWAYEAVGSSSEGSPFEVKVFDPPRKDFDWLLAASKAIDRSLKVFPRHPMAENYNLVVIPEDDESISVYLYPGTTNPKIEVLGADGVVNVKPDGKAEVIQYHKSLMQQPRRAPNTMESHTHLLIQQPVPMDVAYVLMRRPPSPSMIMSEDGMYFIDISGSIISIPIEEQS